MSNLYDSLTPLYYGAKLLGLAPHRRVKNDYKLSKLSFFYTSIAVAFNVLNVSYTIVEFPFYPPQALMLFITKCLVYMNIVSTVMIFINEMRYQKRFRNLLKDLNRIDEMIFEMGVKIDHKKIKFKIFLGVSLQIILSIAVSILDFCAYSDELSYERILFTLLFIIPIIIHGGMSCIVWAYIGIIRNRLKILNIILERMMFKYDFKKRCFRYNCLNEERYSDVLKEIKVIHYKLCAIYNEIGTMYSLSILFAIGLGTAYIFIRLYFYYSAFQHGNKEFFLTLTLIHIVTVMITHILMIGSLVSSCESCKIEAKKSIIILIRIARTSNDVTIINIVRLFILQITVTRIGVYAAEIFTVDRKLVTMLFSSGVTYLVILVQFDLTTI